MIKSDDHLKSSSVSHVKYYRYVNIVYKLTFLELSSFPNFAESPYFGRSSEFRTQGALASVAGR